MNRKMVYIDKILSKGIVMGVSNGEHLLDEKKVFLLNKEERAELDSLYSLALKLNNEYFRLTSENKKEFEKINAEFVDLLDRQIKMGSSLNDEDYSTLNREIKALEKKYRCLETELGLESIKSELWECVEKIEFYYHQVEYLFLEHLSNGIAN